MIEISIIKPKPVETPPDVVVLKMDRETAEALKLYLNNYHTQYVYAVDSRHNETDAVRHAIYQALDSAGVQSL